MSDKVPGVDRSGSRFVPPVDGPRRVLVVEDEGLIALDLKRRLERAGYTVTGTASTADAALASARQDRPDVVLMDIRLPGLRDGVEAANELRREFNLPVLFVTAHADRATLERARLAEPFGYIVKPFTAVNFEPKIEMAIWKNAMEQRLRESERWLWVTMQHAGDGIITTGTAGNIATLNPAAELLLGKEARTLLEHQLCEALQLREADGGMPLTQENLLSTLRAGHSCTALLEKSRAHGRHVECTIASNRDQGALLGMIVVLRDITERVRAAERDKQTQKMRALALLATGAGRELREPLRAIAAHTEECMLEAKGPLLRDLRQIYRSTSRAQSLVHQLAQMGLQEDSGAEWVDINTVTVNLEPRIRKLFRRRQAVRFSLQPDLPSVHINAQGLADSVMTLAMGAQQAAGSDGWVEISTALDDSGGVRITVADSGAPIPERSLPRIFEPYYHSRAGQSDGMSLALVHHFVTVNNGSIVNATTREGANCFSLTFPAGKHVTQGAER